MQNNDPNQEIQKIRKAIAALGIAETNSYENFKRKYKKASLEFHPDKKNRTNQRIVDEATEIFKEIGTAHTELKNRKDDWNAMIRAGRLDNGSWPASKMENYEKRLHPSTPRSHNRPARSGRNNDGPRNTSYAMTGNNIIQNGNLRPTAKPNSSYAMTGNNIIQNGNMRPTAKTKAKGTVNNGPRNTSYAMTGNNIIQNGNLRPNAANNARTNVPSSPPPKRNTTYATRRIIQNDLRMPKKPSFFSRLFARFRGAPKIDPRMFGRPIVNGIFWEHRTDETRMIKIVLKKKEAMKEMEIFARASPSVVAKVHNIFRYGDMHAIVMERVDVQTKRPVTCEDAARIRKIARSLHSAGIAHYCLDGYHLGRRRGGSGELVVVGFEHAEMFDKPVTPEMHDRVMRRDRKPLSDFNVPDLLSSFSC